MIYRIADSADWYAALSSGEFASADLALEGFIHCSTREQVLRTASKYYAGHCDLLLLEIDDAAIGARLRFEDLAGKGESFPHVYASIPLAAVVRHFAFVPDEHDRFSLPYGL